MKTATLRDIASEIGNTAKTRLNKYVLLLMGAYALFKGTNDSKRDNWAFPAIREGVLVDSLSLANGVYPALRIPTSALKMQAMDMVEKDLRKANLRQRLTWQD